MHYRSRMAKHGRSQNFFLGGTLFENFQTYFLIKLRKCIILAYFSKHLTNPALIFRAFGRKTKIVGKFWEKFANFWWKFYRKMEFLFYFYFYFGKFVTKNSAFGNSTIFLQQSFRFRGGDFPPPFPAPGYALVAKRNMSTLLLFLLNIIPFSLK